MQRIQLSKTSPVLSSRPKAHEVFDKVPERKEILLDFSGVDLATPSFLHESLVIFRSKNIIYKTENTNKSIELQLDKARKALS